MVNFLDDFVSRRRASLSDADDDLLARLLHWESDGFRLEGHTLYHQCIFLLNAGHETTSNLIGNSIELLLRHPEARKRLVDRPELIDTCIEEVLRYESPNQLGNRTTRETVCINHVEIPSDTVLTLCIGAANRDSSVFIDADQFDIARLHNPHLAFGAGIHTCAGLNVARLEAKVALVKLLQRFPDLKKTGKADTARA